jgi:hypothetical protein
MMAVIVELESLRSLVMVFFFPVIEFRAAQSIVRTILSRLPDASM